MILESPLFKLILLRFIKTSYNKKAFELTFLFIYILGTKYGKVQKEN